MSTIFYNDGFEVTPELKRQSKLTIYLVFPLMSIIVFVPLSFLFSYFDDQYTYYKDHPLWGIKELYHVFVGVFICLSSIVCCAITFSTLLTWFKVRRSNLVHAVVESLNNGKGLDRSFFNDKLKDRDHFFRADNEKLEIRYELPPNYLKYMILITMIPLAIFLLHLFTNTISDFDAFMLIIFSACFCVTFYNMCLMKRRISFNRLKGTLTYSGLMLPWHRDINFDKVQINAYPESFRMMIPYRLIGLSPVGEYKDAQAWWSFYMWYMDRNRPLPAGTLFTEMDREEDYLRRREMGFPDPIYNSSIDTPEWQGAISKYNDLKALERNDTIYKGSDKLAEQYRIRQAYVKANSYIKQVGSRRK